MNMKDKLLAVAVAGALVAPAAFAQQAAPVSEPPNDWGGWGGGLRHSGRQRSRSSRKRSSIEAYKAQRAANRDRRRRGA